MPASYAASSVARLADSETSMLVMPAIGQHPMATAVEYSSLEPSRRSGNGSDCLEASLVDRVMNSTIMPVSARSNAPRKDHLHVRSVYVASISGGTGTNLFAAARAGAHAALQHRAGT